MMIRIKWGKRTKCVCFELFFSLLYLRVQVQRKRLCLKPSRKREKKNHGLRFEFFSRTSSFKTRAAGGDEAQKEEGESYDKFRVQRNFPRGNLKPLGRGGKEVEGKREGP